MRILAVALSTMLLIAGPALAQDAREQVVDEEGITNPEELTIQHFAKYHDFKRGDPIMCTVGWLAIKLAYYDEGAKIFKQCAEMGNEASMIWMAQLYDNGLGVVKDPKIAVEWERKAAELGYSIGEYNYGLSILRGRTEIQDMAVGKKWVKRAADQGDNSARTLIESDFDLDIAIPDADENKLLF
jgi:hypothetical protein